MRTLPEWSEISAKVEAGEVLTNLEKFIYNQEPAGNEASSEFREQLSNLIEAPNETP